ncbi:hypothetical protein ScPMuIL_018036 [Solemya velum]
MTSCLRDVHENLYHFEDKRLEDFTYADIETTEMIYASINNASFTGTTGQIQFENGERLGRVQIHQIQGGDYKFVGAYSYIDDSLIWNKESPVHWEDGAIPRDKRFEVQETLFISNGVFISMVSLSSVGTVCTVIFLIFNIKKRSHRTVKMSSPRLNNLILSGCLLVYFNVVVSGMDMYFENHLNVLCQIKLWTLSIGFTMAYGAIFSKIWRVHVILIRRKIERRSVKDHQLFVIVGVLTTLETTFLSIWAGLDPLLSRNIQLPPRPLTDVYLKLLPNYYICESKSAAWFPILYSFNGILLLFGVFLAWETRKIHIEALNDSKSVGLCIYNVFIVSTVGMSISQLLQQNKVDEIYIASSACILFATTGTLLAIFLPKVIGVICGANNESVFVAHGFINRSSKVGNASSSRDNDTSKKGPVSKSVGDKKRTICEQEGNPIRIYSSKVSPFTVYEG